jgi:hypothetical protein
MVEISPLWWTRDLEILAPRLYLQQFYDPVIPDNVSKNEFIKSNLFTSVVIVKEPKARNVCKLVLELFFDLQKDYQRIISAVRKNRFTAII